MFDHITIAARSADRKLYRERFADTLPRFQYRHVWCQGDVVIWDNRCTMHKANADYPEGERRLMHRVIVTGTEPV